MGKVMNIKNSNIFNTPLEVGLRSLILLTEATPTYMDLQRLVYYDYLLIHSGDIDNGPSSLHPATPFRSGEIIIKREALKRGLLLMKSKELVEINFSKKGILYKSTNLSRKFLEYFTSVYAKYLKKTAKWVIKEFNDYTDRDLDHFINSNLYKWGSEFNHDALSNINYE